MEWVAFFTFVVVIGGLCGSIDISRLWREEVAPKKDINTLSRH